MKRAQIVLGRAPRKGVNLFAQRWSVAFVDDRCRFCLRLRRFVERFDLFQRIRFKDGRTVSRRSFPPGKNRADLLRELTLWTFKGEVLTGFAAWRWIALRMPATAALAPLLALPGAERAIRRLARAGNVPLECGPSLSGVLPWD